MQSSYHSIASVTVRVGGVGIMRGGYQETLGAVHVCFAALTAVLVVDVELWGVLRDRRHRLPRRHLRPQNRRAAGDWSAESALPDGRFNEGVWGRLM